MPLDLYAVVIAGAARGPQQSVLSSLLSGWSYSIPLTASQISFTQVS